MPLTIDEINCFTARGICLIHSQTSEPLYGRRTIGPNHMSLHEGWCNAFKWRHLNPLVPETDILSMYCVIALSWMPFLEHLLWNCHQLNANMPPWWLDNTGSGVAIRPQTINRINVYSSYVAIWRHYVTMSLHNKAWIQWLPFRRHYFQMNLIDKRGFSIKISILQFVNKSPAYKAALVHDTNHYVNQWWSTSVTQIYVSTKYVEMFCYDFIICLCSGVYQFVKTCDTW